MTPAGNRDARQRATAAVAFVGATSDVSGWPGVTGTTAGDEAAPPVRRERRGRPAGETVVHHLLRLADGTADP